MNRTDPEPEFGRPTLERALPKRPSIAPILFLLAGCGAGIEVDVARPRVGEIEESFSEPAKTRIEETYRVVMPVDGRIGRIGLEPGDRVEKGRVLADFDCLPLEQEVAEARKVIEEIEADIRVNEDNRLENTALIETHATIEAASEALNAFDASVEAEKARADRALRELARVENLAQRGAVEETRLEDVQLDAETAVIELRREQFNRAALKAVIAAVHLGPRFVEDWLGRKTLQREGLLHRLAQARHRLAKAEHSLGLAEVTSPIDGVVLERFDRGGRPVGAGEPLLLIGDLRYLEVVAEVLTQDALLIAEGAKVVLESARGREPFGGTVKRIEPSAFTKLSSLGVEQQRVNAIVSFDSVPEGLGAGFRLHARFLVASKSDALVVPRFSVMQAPDETYYVLKVVDGRLEKRIVEIGLRGDLELEIARGLVEEDVLVAHPEASMTEGTAVRVLKE